MDEQEARLILQACRPGEEDRSDPEAAEAFRMAEGSPALARWLAEEQALDRAIAAQLAAQPVPFGLKTRILAQNTKPATSWRARWVVSLAGAAALLFLLAQVVDLWRHNARPSSASLPGYASEMVSFVRLPPSLDMESADLNAIKGWLAAKGMIVPEVPANLAALHPVGCRVLSFRGEKVTLICFQSGKDRLAHLLVVDRSALPDLKPGASPRFLRVGEWTTATWAEGDRAYMIAAEGDEAAVQPFLPSA